ncbi:MAG TPA: HTTM domain-containing protein [Nannocystaceae bacterium]|nr:HTTM domain-containing protein [Nannocystaceae bacterium]
MADRFDRVLDRVWLAPEDPTALGLVRIAVVAVLTASLLTHVGAVADYFSNASPLFGEWARDAFPSRFSILFYIESPWAVRLFFAIVAIAHVLWMVGRFTVPASIVAWLGWVSLTGRHPLLYSLPDQLQMAMCTLLVFMPSGRGLSLDAKKHGSKPVPVWCRRVLMVQIATLYTATGLLKHGNTWHADGTALYYSMVNPYNRHFDVPELLATMQPWLLRPMTWVVVWWEVLFAAFVAWQAVRELAKRPRWLPDLRIPWLGFGVAMHLGIQAMMYVAWFSPMVLASYLAFLRPEEASKWIARLRRRASG